jgi:hypothetical protein
MPSDLIQSMSPYPGSEGVDGGLHAIRLTNHQRIFLKHAYQKVIMVMMQGRGLESQEGIEAKMTGEQLSTFFQAACPRRSTPISRD